MTDRYRAPHANELEISLFGPGYGEALVIHLGNNQWVIVDSCIDPGSQAPAALTYLDRLQVDAATAVKLIVATHWHDDHIRGLGTIARESSSASIAVSSALSSEQFLRLIGVAHRLSTATSSGLDELDQILMLLEERRRKPARANAPYLAIMNRQLLRSDLRIDDQMVTARIHALSPSDSTVTLAANTFAQLLPLAGAPKKRFVSPSPNHASVVLWIEVGNHAVLLGADLERTSDPNTGWTAICDNAHVVNTRAGVFKVAHHGGVSGHEGRVWSDLLRPNSHAILTPYARGNKHLPTQADAQRICALTPHAFATAKPAVGSHRWTNPIVRSMVTSATKNIRNVHSSWGQVRLRAPIAGDPESWTVELFGSAFVLQDMA